MALLFMDGFDAGDALAKWDQGNSGASHTTTPYGDGRSWRLYSFSHYLKKNITPTVEVFMGVHYRTDSTMMEGYGILKIYADSGVTQHLSLVFTDPTTIAVYRGSTMIASGAASEPLNTWAYLEMSATIHDTTGTCNVRVNGTPVIAFTGDTKNAGSSTNIDAVGLGSYNGSIFYDNFYVCDSTGSAPYNTFLGEIRIGTISPDGAGSTTQFTPSTGANYAAVDELPYSSTEYVRAIPMGTRDTYTMSDISVGYDILAVQNNVIAKKTDAGGTALKSAIVSGGTTYYGPSVTLTPTDRTISDLRTQDPATSATWDVTGVNSIEAGMEIA